MKIFATAATAFLCVVLTLTLVSAGGNAPDKGDLEKNTFGPRGKVTFVEDEENIVASELIGTWVPALEISTGLVPPSGDMSKGSGFTQSAYTYTFENDELAKDRIKRSLEENLKALQKEERERHKVAYVERAFQAIYLTGSVSVTTPKDKTTVIDFALVSAHGNPKLIYREEDGDLESQNVMLSRDEDGDADVLWIGGDFNNQDMSPFIRKEHAEKLRAGVEDEDGYVRFVDTKRNLISQEIWGTWEINKDVSDLVGGNQQQSSPDTMSFLKDDEARARIEEELESMAAETVDMGAAEHPESKEFLHALSRVYASGLMTTKTGDKQTETDFVVVTLHGEPMLVFQRPDEKLQVLRLQFVCDIDGENDLLFIGTDLPEKPPQAFQRVVDKD